MKQWRARVIVAVGILLLLVAIVAAMKPKPLPVEEQAVVIAPLEQRVTDDGRARIRERYTVSAPVAGTLARIELHEGDSVEPGAVLARLLPLPSPLLDPRARDVAQQRVASAQDAHLQAQVTLQRALAAAETAQRDFERTRSLASREAAPQAQVESAAAEYKLRQMEAQSAQFAERVAAHGVDEARAALETFTSRGRSGEQLELTSPVHGKVLHVLHRDEGVVTGGTALIEVGDPSALELVVDVLSQDASQVRPSMPARILHWGVDQPALKAKVRRVEPAAFTRVSALGVDEQRVNVLLDLDSPKEAWSALGDGFAVEVEIVSWSKPDVLQVPTSALFRDAHGEWALFVDQSGRAALRRVQVGHRGPLQTEVLAGLTAGERAIVHPGATVKSGAAVEAKQ